MTTRLQSVEDLERLDFAKGAGVVTVVTQDARTGVVLMVAQADREALERTIASGDMHYRSRTRGPWHKGATSGNTQRVVALYADCDGDAVLAVVEPAGPACHTGDRSCFGDPSALGVNVLAGLNEVIRQRASESATSARSSYTCRLLDDRNLRLKKIGEEAAELVLACADDDRERAAEEAADLLYHMMVALRGIGVEWTAVEEVLRGRGQGA